MNYFAIFCLQSFKNSADSISKSVSCIDSDNGNNIFVKGTINATTPKYGNTIVNEYCSDEDGANLTKGDYVEELVCLEGDPDYAYIHKRVKCPNGCLDGVCIGGGADTSLNWNIQTLSSVDDVHNFVNGKGSFTIARDVQSITWATDKTGKVLIVSQSRSKRSLW